ncbi:MAG: Gfo/Idh/MocA family oxidoreductase [Armatimonadetes bacterium]|nr:Gfo/Idh/MocA family oxidoreductase [Armatimonadota bacterium]
MVQVVLVGAGSHSTTQHAPSLQRYVAEHPGRARLAAVCDLDPARAERAAAQFGFARTYTRVADLLAAERVDAAVLVMPIPAILPMLAPFLERRIPIEIEKPMGTGIGQERAIAAQARAAGSPVMVSFNRRFTPGLRLALEWARAQGPVRCARGAMLRSGRVEPDFIWGTGIHLLDALCGALGPLTIPQGAGATVEGPGGCWRAVRLDGPNGVAVTVEILPACGRTEECYRFAGDGYCVDVWADAAHSWRVEGYRGGKRDLFREAAPDEPGFVSGGIYHETAAFLDAVAAGRPLPGPTPDEAMHGTSWPRRCKRCSAAATLSSAAWGAGSPVPAMSLLVAGRESVRPCVRAPGVDAVARA